MEIAAACFGTVAFSVLFGVPRRHYFFCGLTGGVGWAAYRLALALSLPAAEATLAATVVLAVLARALAVRRKTPVTLFLVCGIFTLVPGAGIYYTAYALIMNDSAGARARGLETAMAALAIALGIAVAYSLPARLFGGRAKPRGGPPAPAPGEENQARPARAGGGEGGGAA